MTQAQFTELLQVGGKSLSRWETGKWQPTRSINLLLHAINDGELSIDYLKGKSKKNTAYSIRKSKENIGIRAGDRVSVCPCFSKTAKVVEIKPEQENPFSCKFKNLEFVLYFKEDELKKLDKDAEDFARFRPPSTPE